MRNLYHLTFLVILTVFAGSPLIGRGQTNLTTIKSQGSGSFWSQAIWATNAPGTFVNTAPLVVPVAGNTYEEVFNGTLLGYNTGDTRLRNPTSSGSSQTFPGDSLMMDTNTEIRFKDVSGLSNPYPANFPGVNGNPGLIMNGGLLNDGDNGIWNIQGSIEMVGGTLSVLAPGGNLGNTPPLTEAARSFIMGGVMSGNGSLALVLTPTNNPVLVTNALNTFNGNWIIQEGWLIGTTPQCLGSANITVDPYATIPNYPALTLETDTTPNDGPVTNQAFAILDFDYAAVCTGTLILTNGGLMNLHTNCIFGNLTIEGTTLANGVYSYNYLTNNFTNFLAGGYGQITIAAPVAPPAPTGVATITGNGQELVTWLPAATATGYIINRAASSGGPYSQVGTTNSLTFIDGSVVNGTTYWYEVQATNAFGFSTNSFPPVSGTPEGPVAGVVSTVNPSSVGLTWNSFAGAASYTVQRSTINGGPYTTIASGIAPTHYTDSSAANGTLYYYVVFAPLTGGSQSAPSAQVSALTYPSLPTLALDLYGTNGIALEETSSDPVTPSYVENVSTDGIHWSLFDALGAPTNFDLDSGLTEGNTYYFQVQAQNASGSSAFTVPVSTTVPVGAISIAFGNGNPNGPNGASPSPVGYLQDIGIEFPNMEGNYIAGWSVDDTFTNGGYDMSSQGGYNGNFPPGDQRKQSFILETEHSGGTSILDAPYAVWGITNIPNGLYVVRIVSGDATANNSVYEQAVNGITTPSVAPGGGIFFAQWYVDVSVTNGILYVSPVNPTNEVNVVVGNPSYNDKLDYVDIYPSGPAVLSLAPSGGGNLQLSWPNNALGLVLLQATNLAGPWVANPAASSPYTFTPTNNQTYFRLQWQ